MDISEPNYLTEGHWDWKPMWDPVNNEDIVFFRSHDYDFQSPNSISVVNINDPDLEVHDVEGDRGVSRLVTSIPERVWSRPAPLVSASGFLDI